MPEVGEDGLYNSVPGPNIFRVLSHRATEGSKTKAASTFSYAVSHTEASAVKHLYGRSSLWDRICVQVGGLLLLDWCIIKDLKVTFPNTKAQVLHDFRQRNANTKKASNTSLENGTRFKAHLQPIQAELEVTVSTVMGMTRATFRDMLYQNESIEGKADAPQKPVAKTPADEELESLPGYENYQFKDSNGQPIVPIIFAL